MTEPNAVESTSESDRTPNHRSFRRSICIGGTALCWTALLLLIQAMSFRTGFEHDGVFVKFLIRLVLNLLFTSTIVLLFPRWLAFLSIVVSAVCGVGLIVYADYFGESMSVLTLFANFNEGTAVGDAIVSLIPWTTVGLLALPTAACGLFLFLAGRPDFSFRKRLIVSGSTLAGYLILVAGLSRIPVFAFSDMTEFFGKEVGDLMVVYGYLPVWSAEWILKNEGEITRLAQEQPCPDRLTPREGRLELPRQIVAVQMETLDFAILDRTFEGKVVTPFLNTLKTKSFFYKIDAFHYNGSSDADFAFLTGREPSRHTLNYKLRMFVYRDTLVEALAGRGYRTYSFHNGMRSFFNRYSAFRKIGFDEMTFAEDMVERYGLETEWISYWKTVRDDILYEIASRQISTDREKGFYFVITLLGHTPFRNIREKEIFADPATLKEYYVNSVHVMDRQFGKFHESLPDGTLVVLYGDHSSNLNEPDYVSKTPGGKDYVPCMISIKGRSISDRQKTDPDVAADGELTLADISNYLRSLPDAPPEKPEVDPSR